MVSATEQGCALVETRRQLERVEADWLGDLVDFDLAELWREDGHVCAASWLVERCGFARATAFEKLRVAHELRRRPVLRDALVERALSYSKLRVITRIIDGGAEFDELMLQNAPKLTADELEQAVEHWDYVRNQDSPPPDFSERRRIRRYRGFGGGMGRAIIDDWDENLDRLFNFFDAYIQWCEHRSGAVDESPTETRPPTFEEFAAMVEAAAGMEIEELPLTPTLAQKRLDALNDLIEVAASMKADVIDVERAAIGVTVSYENLIAGIGAGDTSSGHTLTGEAVRRLACEGGINRIVTRGASDILDVGRQTRQWNRAQRRAIKRRHKNKCAVKGCHRRITEIHHVWWWEDGGETCIENGVPLCFGHHHLVHEGKWQISYNAETGETRLVRSGREPLVAFASFTPAA